MEENIDKVPEKKKRVSKKKPEIEDTINQEALKKLLKDALLMGKESKKSDRDLEIDALISTTSEFLKTFIIIGYDLKSHPVTVMNATNQLDADALMTSLTRLFIEVHNKNNGNSNF